MKRSNKKTSKKTNKTNKKSNTQNKQSIEQMKYEIANEFGVSLGAESASRANGTVGGEITKRLVKMGKSKLGNNKTSK